MISLIQPEDQVPMTQKLMQAHAQFINRKLVDALMAKFGVLPPLEEIAAHVTRVQETNGTVHYVWEDKETKIGETIDMSQVLFTVEPMKIFKPEN